MASRKFKLIATGEHAAKRLDSVLADWLPQVLKRPLSKAKVRKLVMAGAVSVNGKPFRLPSKLLTSGATIEAYVDPVKLFQDSTSRDKEFELTPDRILFEDGDLIIIDKPPGLPSHPTLDETRDNLFAAVTRYLGRRDGGTPYLGIHQRLDRDTSGIVLFTKSRRVNPAMAEVFSRHRAVKVYQALTTPPRASSRRKLDRGWTVKNCLGKVSRQSKRAKYGAVDADGDPAETAFRIVEQHPHGIWIEAIPKTGRTHQIRVHLAEYGLPILGDDLYGRVEAQASRLMLHASRLAFPHPVTGKEVSVESPLPEDFKRKWSALRAGI
jgi:RluA family pseudouridine synthase